MGRKIGVMLAALLLAGPGCKKDKDGEAGPSGDPAVAALGVGEVGFRRLSRHEYDRVIDDLLMDDTLPASAFLPNDVIDPFDNDYTTQQVSAVLVTGLEGLANDVAARLVADPLRRDALLPCTPAGDDDPVCMESFIRDFGRLALRRPVSEAEVAELLDLAARFTSSPGDFYEGMDVVVRALLQHPSFVYRVELGHETAEPGVFELNGYEKASRLSFLLWGSTPDAWLLDQAEAGDLDAPAGVRAAASAMLDDPAARDRMDRFHAMWMGYWSLPHPPDLTAAFRAETRALVEDVVFEQPSSWFDLFTAQSTYIDDTLGSHYGLSGTGAAPAWVDYGGSGRQGILSHGSFLSVNAKFGDTSPTLRGKLVRERLLCQTIPPPPPGVNVDEPPQGDGSSDCKVDRYAIHAESGTCKTCHDLVDPIGFGIENFDQQGQYRTSDVGDASCIISGDGDVDGEPFNGPAGLADLLVAGSDLSMCAVEQTYRLAMGHASGTTDAPYIERLSTTFGPNDHRMDQLILELVGDEAFGYRREEEVSP